MIASPNHAATVEARLRERLGGELLDATTAGPARLYLEVSPGGIGTVARVLFEDLGARFQIATGTDTPDGVEILYHWAFDRAGLIVSVRTRLEREAPKIDSIATICAAAEWIEREMWELLGIEFRNHPDLRHLLLDDDWPPGKYPLRRDYQR